MNQSILAILQNGEKLLSQAGIENPRLAAEIIFRSVLKLRRVDLYLEPKRLVDDRSAAAFDAMIARKLNREPLQYVVGETEWFGLTINCDRRALVPRPETEIVVERALELIRNITNPLVVDIGTGTGCIAIAMATSRPDARIIATDSSADALSLAKENILLHTLDQRVELRQGNLINAIKTEEQFDLIISNPPYIRTSEYDGLMPEVRDYEPREALVAGDDGLEVIRPLIAESHLYLKEDGVLVFEFGIDHAEAVGRLASENGNYEVEGIIIDYNRRERGIVLRKKN